MQQRTRRQAALAGVALLLALAPMAAAGAGRSKEMVLYVAVNGSDANPGTKARPFATLARARDALRAKRKAGELPDGPVTVRLRGGIYRVTETLELTAEDSGREGAPVVWQAAPGEEVRLVGGVRLTGFQPLTDPAVLARLDPEARGKVLQVDLKASGAADFGRPTPAGGPRAELICDNRYMPLARYPNAGEWVRVAGIPQGGTKIETESDSHFGRFAYEGDRPARWKDPSDVWVHGYWVHDWADQYLRIQKLDVEKHEIWPQPPHHHYGYRKGQRFYFLNVLEELDQPGEWYLDREAGILYFWPPYALGKAEVLFPQLGKPMWHLKGAEHVRLSGMTLECSGGAAILVEGGSHNEVAGCTVRNFGAGSAVRITGTQNGIRSCDLYECAGTGVTLEGGDRKTLTPGGLYAVNCELHRLARVYRTYHGAFSISGVGNRIAHCSVHDLPHQGIAHYGNDHVIEYCDFTRIAQETGDVGVTYSMADWTFLGNEFRYNYFHGIHGPGQLGCFTIYPDLPCGGIHLHHNIFYDVDQVFHTNSGRGMVIENNVFVRCRGVSFNVWTQDHMFRKGGAWRMAENLEAVGYDRPPYSTRYPLLQRLAQDFATDRMIERERPKDNVIRRNVSQGSVFLMLHPQASLEHVRVEDNLIADDVVFTGSFDGSGKSGTYRNGDPTVAAELGKRGNVIVSRDRGLGDLPAHGFRLPADPPAQKLGFEPIPFEQMGLQVDEYRKTLPADVPAPLIDPPSRTFVKPLTVRLVPEPMAGGRRCVVRYTLDGKEPTGRSPLYSRPIRLADSATVKAAAFVKHGRTLARSRTVSATYTATHLGPGGVYLSDLPEEEVFAYPSCWRKDMNHLGAPLRLGGKEYPKGLLLHPDETKDGQPFGRVVYRLDGELRRARRFSAAIGIDDAMHVYGKGSAAFIVEVYRSGRWEQVLRSGVLKLGDPPQGVSVDIAGADRLRLTTTDAGDGIACDHAVWALARVE